MSAYEAALVRAQVPIEGHVVLNSGLHTDVKYDCEKLLAHPKELHFVMSGLARLIQDSGSELIVPVPKGGLRIYSTLPSDMTVIFTEKRGQRDFRIPKQYHKGIRAAEKIVVGEDVVTTGGTPAAMAEVIQQINPDAELHLVGILRRSELEPRHQKSFRTAQFLVEKEVDSWPKEVCDHCRSTQQES